MDGSGWRMCFFPNKPCGLDCGDHGSCAHTFSGQKCVCVMGWTGPQCQTPVCELTCLHGKCIAPNECKCNPGWTGPQCQTPVCELTCLHGKCIAPNKCQCKLGWEGDSCQTPVCDKICQNGGKCIASNECKCACGWEGKYTFCANNIYVSTMRVRSSVGAKVLTL